MKEQEKTGIELKIREHSDADFFPEKCPICKSSEVKRLTLNHREVQ